MSRDDLILAVLVPFVAIWWALWLVIGMTGDNPAPDRVTPMTCAGCTPVPYEEGTDD